MAVNINQSYLFPIFLIKSLLSLGNNVVDVFTFIKTLQKLSVLF